VTLSSDDDDDGDVAEWDRRGEERSETYIYIDTQQSVSVPGHAHRRQRTRTPS
jgi:hypothetical protein